MVAKFCLAVYLVSTVWQTWEEAPVVTSTDLVPVESLPFPAITFCPPGSVTIINSEIKIICDEFTFFSKCSQFLNYFKIFQDLTTDP